MKFELFTVFYQTLHHYTVMKSCVYKWVEGSLHCRDAAQKTEHDRVSKLSKKCPNTFNFAVGDCLLCLGATESSRKAEGVIVADESDCYLKVFLYLKSWCSLNLYRLLHIVPHNII